MAELAHRFGTEVGMPKCAKAAGLLHDFGKYSEAFQNVLTGTATSVDHAVCAAAYLYGSGKTAKPAYRMIAEAAAAHHSALRSFESMATELRDICRGEGSGVCWPGKKSALFGPGQFIEAQRAFARDFSDFKFTAEHFEDTSADRKMKDAPVLAGMKFVHWYDKPIPDEDDCIGTLFPSLLEDEDDEEEAELEPDVNRDQARRQADEVISTITSGKSAHELPNLYYFLLLSGVSGRVMVRSYEEGSYQTLVENLQQWETDLRLANSFGTAELKPAKLTARLIRLLSRQNSDKNIFERMSKELAGLTPAIINAIINGTQFPDAVASRALAYIRSQMFSSGEEEQSRKVPDPWACQWLKAWLCRREREKYQKEELSMEYNEKHPDPAYHCGALVAVYGEIQSRAMPDVNASLID